jgi:hypothetical protein
MWKTMKNRIVSRIASNATPAVAVRTAAPRMVAKAPPPAVVYNWTRDKRRRGIGPSATNNRNRQVVANSAIITFTYH